jgi:hypothetical protein
VLNLELNPFPVKFEGVTKMLFDHIGPEMKFPMNMIIANQWLFSFLVEAEMDKKNSTRATLHTTTASPCLTVEQKKRDFGQSQSYGQSSRASRNHNRPSARTRQPDHSRFDHSYLPPEWNVMENDTDGDGVDNDVDNCPEVANTNQDDFDGNGVGDGCDEDVDGDGVLNAVDACPLTPLAEVVSRTGCAITQLCPCTGPRGIRTAWKNHGAYVSCVAQATGNFVKLRLITLRTALHQVSAAAQSKCGK